MTTGRTDTEATLEVVRQLAPFGAEVDLDLSVPLDEPTRAALRAALDAASLLVFRGQSLSFDAQRQVLESFGPVLVDDPHQLGFTSVTNVGPGAAGGSEEITFHYDLAYCPEPFPVISLLAAEVEDERTTTRYVSGTRAYDQLDPELRTELAGRMARHVYPGGGHRGIMANRRPFDPHLPHTLRPAVWTHPRTGRPILSVSWFSTDAILGVEASTELLDRLFALLYADENTYAHSWRRGDLVVWDNLALQHARGEVPASKVGRRVLQKVVAADRGQAEQFPEYDGWRLAEDVIDAATG